MSGGRARERPPSAVFALDGSRSQYGQETLVGRLMFPGIRGFYLDVGASDGIRASNTSALYRAGWRGICVEANPEAFAALSRNRPEDGLVCAAASDRDGDTVPFVQFRTGPLGRSGLRETFRDPERLARAPHAIIAVRTATLTRILAEHGAPSFIHYLDLDVEGCELPALGGLDFSAYAFGVIGVETRPGMPDHEAIVAFLAERGYVAAAQLGADTMFIPTREWDRAPSGSMSMAG